MIFDKINFVLDVLSSETIIANNQNLIKLFIADSIGQTPITEAEYRITLKDGRNVATAIQDWTSLDISGTFYESSFTPVFTADCTFELGVRVTDKYDNKYFLQSTLKGVVR